MVHLQLKEGVEEAAKVVDPLVTQKFAAEDLKVALVAQLGRPERAVGGGGGGVRVEVGSLQLGREGRRQIGRRCEHAAQLVAGRWVHSRRGAANGDHLCESPSEGG